MHGCVILDTPVKIAPLAEMIWLFSRCSGSEISALKRPKENRNKAEKFRHQTCCVQIHTPMQENFSVTNHLAGTVHINRSTGALSWDHVNLDPVIRRYVKMYLFDEGFIEHALGMLDPGLDEEVTALLKSLAE
jgi:hypothetical protein